MRRPTQEGVRRVKRAYIICLLCTTDGLPQQGDSVFFNRIRTILVVVLTFVKGCIYSLSWLWKHFIVFHNEINHASLKAVHCEVGVFIRLFTIKESACE